MFSAVGGTSQKAGIILVEKLVIETFAKDFTGALFNFADVNQHSCRWIHGTGEDEVGDVIATAPVTRVRFRAEGAQVFSIRSIANVQTPGGGEFQALADCKEHDSAKHACNLLAAHRKSGSLPDSAARLPAWRMSPGFDGQAARRPRQPGRLSSANPSAARGIRSAFAHPL